MATNPNNSKRRNFPARVLNIDSTTRYVKMGRRPDFAQERREAALRRHYDSLKTSSGDRRARIKKMIQHALVNLQTTEAEFKAKFTY